MEYVTIKQAAKLLSVSRPTVYKLVAGGKLKIKRIAERPVIAMTEIDRYRRNGGKSRG